MAFTEVKFCRSLAKHQVETEAVSMKATQYPPAPFLLPCCRQTTLGKKMEIRAKTASQCRFQTGMVVAVWCRAVLPGEHRRAPSSLNRGRNQSVGEMEGEELPARYLLMKKVLLTKSQHYAAGE